MKFAYKRFANGGQSGFFDLFAFVKFERSQGIIELGPLLQPGATA
jgi:hypothetical protein